MNKYNTREIPDHPDSMDLDKLEEWSLPQEDAILRRVKKKLDQQFFTPVSIQLRLRHWTLLATTGAALALLLVFFWKPLQKQSHPIQTRGGIVRLTSKTSTPKSDEFSFQVPADKQGKIGVSNRWKLQAEGKTQLTISPPSDKQKVKLHWGFVKFHIIPFRMKSFVVQVKQLRITVHGTKFTVERTKNWLRLEVWRGKVSLSGATQTRQYLLPRQGIRVDFSSGEVQRYDMPPQQQSQPHQRWQWMERRKQTKLLLQYLSDISQSRRYSRGERQNWMEAAASWTRRHHHFVASYKFRWQAYLLASKKEDRDQRLFQAAQACRKAYSIVSKHCAELYQKYLTNHSSLNPTYKAFSHYWSTVHRVTQAASEAQALVYVQKHIKQTRDSYHSKELQRLLTPQKTFSQAPFCLWMKRIAPKRYQQLWIKQKCK